MTPTHAASQSADAGGASVSTPAWVVVDSDAVARISLESKDRSMATSAWQAVDPTRSLARPTALSAACTCPAFCERDHANE